jgi:hypothetical protein
MLHACKLQRLFATVSGDGLKTMQIQDLRKCVGYYFSVVDYQNLRLAFGPHKTPDRPLI